LKSRLPALLCVLALLFCALATQPIAEIGIDDDWSYVKSARVLAQTGHIVYYGWATPMLGWQLFLGALFVRLFGPSFTAIRASTLLIALVTAFLTQRIMVRAGVSSRNATIGTLAFVLSPLFLPLALSFMTDIGGLFCIALCLYACLCALQAHTDRAILAWLAFAALSNDLGGTIRQIAWLGVLVMVPCTVWLLRHRPRVVFSGVVLYIISLGFVLGSLHWFQQQPYSLPEPLIVEHVDGRHLIYLAVRFLSFFFRFALFLLPILLAFVRGISFRNGRAGAYLIFGLLLCAAICLFPALHHPDSFRYILAPYNGNYVTPYGLADTTPIKGTRPIVLTPELRIVFTIAVLLALLCFLNFLLTNVRLTRFAGKAPRISWNSLLILLVPFTLVYLSLLLPRSINGDLFDRYLLPLLLIGFIFLLRLFQDCVRPSLPLASYALVLLYAFYAVAGTHDAFSMYRARQAAFAELRGLGVPATSIDGGFEQNGMTQIERFGYINEPRIRVPTTIYIAQSSPFPKDCEPQMVYLTPAIVPGYALSFDPQACGGPSRFDPVTYRAWLGAHAVTLYVVDTVKDAHANR
jgi:hypothetical protein